MNMIAEEFVAKSLIDLVNYSPFCGDDFVKIICNEHRTLQQSVMRLFIKVIKGLSEVNTDDRNEDSVELAKEIAVISEKHNLPYI